MAKTYDYKKVIELINENSKKLQSAELGMLQDWYYTAEKVWEKKDGFLVDLEKEPKIAGINSSYWATPYLKLEFKNGMTKEIECYIEIN